MVILTKEETMLLLVPAVVLAGVGLIAVYEKLIIPFKRDQRYYKMEIKRSEGDEKRYWKRELRKLYISYIPIIRHFKK